MADDRAFDDIADRLMALEGMLAESNPMPEMSSTYDRQEETGEPLQQHKKLIKKSPIEKRKQPANSGQIMTKPKKITSRQSDQTNWAKRVLNTMAEVDEKLTNKPDIQSLMALSIGLDDLRDKLSKSISSRISKIESMVQGEGIKREHIDSLMAKGVTAAIRHRDN